MKSYICIFLLFSFSAIANKEWPDTSGMYADKKSSEILSKHRQELSLIIEELLKEDVLGLYKDEVKFHMKSWEIYIDSACRIVGSSTGAASGWAGSYMNDCKVKLIFEKISQIRNSIKCIQNLTPALLSEGASHRLVCYLENLNVVVKKT